MLNKDAALVLIKHYMSGWKNNDFCLIASTLDHECKIIESHGPIYYGIDDVQLWFNLWITANSKILKWDLTSYYYEKNAAFTEWNFECISNNTKYFFSGSSVVKFSHNKIKLIHEYRMTKPAFDWDKKSLISD